jgi:RNA polymerase sigma factor (sigma-70 family)
VSPRLSELLLSSQSDERLVSLARAGHERAFDAIVERYRPELQAMARRLCRDGHSEDVVQQAFLSAFTALRSGSEVRHLRGWLYQILRNAAGRPQAPPCVPLDRATPTSDSLEEVVQQRALAMSALSEIARLPARQRQAMVGTALDGRARAEIASSMGLSEGAVRQLVHRARSTLRGAVTAVTPWPLARWLAGIAPDAPGPGELATGAGAVSSGGLVLKLGALLASGTFLTGAAVHLEARPSHHGGARAAIAVHPPRTVARTALPSPARFAPSAPRISSRSRSVPTSVARPAGHHDEARGTVDRGRHEEASIGSGRRSERSSPEDHGGRDDSRRVARVTSDHRGRDDGRDGGLPAQLASTSRPLDSPVEESGSRHDGVSGDDRGGTRGG